METEKAAAALEREGGRRVGIARGAVAIAGPAVVSLAAVIAVLGRIREVLAKAPAATIAGRGLRDHATSATAFAIAAIGRALPIPTIVKRWPPS